MISGWIILPTSLAYLGLLFAIAYYGDRRAAANRSIISNPYIYSLSLAVYCTAWTFYGSVGRAANYGIQFLPIYIGPTLMVALWWLVMRKIIRISKRNRITSIADFIGSRYGKSTTLSGVVTIIAVIGIIPYISLQLKAISVSFQIINGPPATGLPNLPLFQDTSFYIAMILAVFTILFGTRHLDATERHEGMVAAIAFESVVKLIAFLAVGIFVTYGVYNGFHDVFSRAESFPRLQDQFTLDFESGEIWQWIWLTALSMMAIMFLPRQFQVAVIENVDETHVKKAMWLFPLYLLVINIFVLPIAAGGVMHFTAGGMDPDTFVLTLPLVEGANSIALLVFLGGLSAATGMVIVETIALSTMICNDLVMPILLRSRYLRLERRRDLTGWLLTIRRTSIIGVILLGYIYFHYIAEYFTLVSIGLISFAAVAQFAPAILGGIYWKRGSQVGALTGLVIGFLVWIYTLPFPSLVEAGMLSQSILTEGPFGIELLRPHHLFGLQGFDPIGHALFWSIFLNAGFYVSISLFSKPTALEYSQASLFVDVFRYTDVRGISSTWQGGASSKELHSLLRRFLGKRKADEAFTIYAKRHKINWKQALEADADFVNYAEQLLAGAIGAATARVMISHVVQEVPLSPEEVKSILDETKEVLAHSKELEIKSRELEKATRELKAANQRLKELDQLKDDFVSTVTHELRTPLTSVRAFTEIIFDNPDLELNQRQHFLNIIIKESERLTRLINQLLDLQKIESETMEWHIDRVDMNSVIKDAVNATSQLMREKALKQELSLPDEPVYVQGDRDRLIQVMLNLLSNAIKFCDQKQGHISVSLVKENNSQVRVDVEDNGIGIRPEDIKVIFEKFRQVHDPVTGRPTGSGLGLPITRRIIEYHRGKIWVKSELGKGSCFSFLLPLAREEQPTQPAEEPTVA